MKLKKILAAVAAAAVAVSTMAVSAFAVEKGNYVADDGGNTFFYLVADDGKPQWAIDNSVAVTDVYGVTWHATFKDSEVANESTWIGGGMGANSNSTGWKQIEWGRNEKEIIADLANGTITWKSADPIFKADDKYAQLWITAWGGTVTFDSAELLDAEGNVIAASANAAAPAETEAAPAETEAETTEAAPEETEAAPEETEAAPEAEEAEEEVDVDVDEEDADVDEEPEEEAAPVETEAAPVEEAPAAETATPAPATGNTAAAAIVAVMAVAGVAAVATKKRK